MTQVDRLEALLSNVQKNRKLPREATPSSPALARASLSDAGGLGRLSPSMIPALRSPAVPDIAVERQSLRPEVQRDSDEYEVVSDVVESAVSLAPPPQPQQDDEPHISIAPPAVLASASTSLPPEGIDVHVSIAPPADDEPQIEVAAAESAREPEVAEPAIEVAAAEIRVEHEVFAPAAPATSVPVIRVVAVTRSEARMTFGTLLGRSLAARPKASRST